MTTIREEMPGSASVDGWVRAALVLRHLGIDPDLPAEWATVDRCLTWLREATADDLGIPEIEFDLQRQGNPLTAGYWVQVGDHEGRTSHIAPTLHAALIAACKAVQEANQ